jgi:hypothetical protein
MGFVGVVNKLFISRCACSGAITNTMMQFDAQYNEMWLGNYKFVI